MMKQLAMKGIGSFQAKRIVSSSEAQEAEVVGLC